MAVDEATADAEFRQMYGDDVVQVEELLKADTDDPIKVTLPSGKGSMWIQALTRDDVLTARKAVEMGDMTAAEMEAEWICKALVAPKMTFEQVRAWQKTPKTIPDITELTEQIALISGTKHGAQKSNIQNVRTGSRNGMGNVNRRKVR